MLHCITIVICSLTYCFCFARSFASFRGFIGVGIIGIISADTFGTGGGGLAPLLSTASVRFGHDKMSTRFSPR